MKIGIVGSAFQTTENEINTAKALGTELSKAKTDVAVCFDPSSLPMEAGKELIKQGKKAVCFAANAEEEKTADELGFFAVNLNLPRLFREIVFVSNVDALIVCGGGSGTLMEVTFAYQMNKPIFLLEEIKGTASIFKNKFLDKRERVLIKEIKVGEVCNAVDEMQKCHHL